MTLLARRGEDRHAKAVLSARDQRQLPPAGPAWTLRHIPALDGIRGLAVVAVLLFHGDVLRGGYLGVDAFFVLSGFLITGLLLNEVGNADRVDLVAFWIRRARRLLPALLVLILGVALFAQFVATASELGQIRSDALATLGYFANWHAISQGDGYWSLFQAPSPLEHTWSLAIEEQFYLLWPLIVGSIAWFSTRSQRRNRGSARDRTARRVLVLCVVLIGMSVGVMALLVRSGQDPSRAYYGTDTRAASILIGAALAALLTLRGAIRGRRLRVALEVGGVAAFVGLGVAWATVDGQSTGLYRGGFFLCGIAVAIVIATAAHPRPGPLSKLLSLKPLCALGLVSYGLYLWHWPLYIVVNEARTGLDGWGLLGLRIALSVAIATLSYFAIELPIRRGSMSSRGLLVLGPAVAVACVSAIILTTAGAVTTTTGPVLPSSAANGDGATTKPNGSGTTTGSTSATSIRLLVVGDSVSVGIGDAASYLEGELGITARSAGLPGCVLEDGIPARAIIHETIEPLDPGHPCLPVWRAQEREFSPSHIVMIFGNAGNFQDLMPRNDWVGPCDREYRTWYVPRFRSAVTQFVNGGANVAIVRLPHVMNDWAPSDAAARIDCVNAMNLDVARSIDGVRVVDLASFVCPGGLCRQSIDGYSYRVDGMHFSPEAAGEIARWLVGKILAERPDATRTEVP